MQHAGRRDGASYIEDVRYVRQRHRHLNNSPGVKSEARQLDREQSDSRCRPVRLQSDAVGTQRVKYPCAPGILNVKATDDLEPYSLVGRGLPTAFQAGQVGSSSRYELNS